MKSILLSILSTLVFLVSFQNTLILADYYLNRNFYEKHCINTANPELECHGKCEVKKVNENSSAPVQVIKKHFEFHIFPLPAVEFPLKNAVVYRNSEDLVLHKTTDTLKGYHRILPHPPQIEK